MVKNNPNVAVYFSSTNVKNKRKNDVLLAFLRGIQRQKLTVIPVYDERRLVRARLAVILGWYSPHSKLYGVNLVRKNVILFQKNTGNKVMAIDAGCWKYCDPDNRFLRYSLNGVFYDQDEYANKNSSQDKYNLLSKELGITLQPWKTDGHYILLLMQRNAGWSMKGLTPLTWVTNKIEELKKYTDRKILVRPHPIGTKLEEITSLKKIPGIKISNYTNTSIQEDLRKAHAALVFNSSSGVAAIMNGVPLFVDDKSAVCYQVANYDLKNIENPARPERQQWLNDLAACHWSDDEVLSGQLYQKFKQYL